LQRQYQDYQSVYINLYEVIVKINRGDKETINDDIVLEVKLIKKIEVNINYILMLVVKYKESNCKDKTIITDIEWQ